SLKKLLNTQQTDLEAKQDQLKKDREALEKEAKAGKTPQDVLQRKAEAWQKRAVEVQNLSVQYDQEMQRQESQLTAPIYNKVVGILKRTASTDGYDMIINKAAVPHYRSDLDLTDRAIQMYNAANPVTGTKPSAPATPGSSTPAKATPAEPAPAQPAPKATA